MDKTVEEDSPRCRSSNWRDRLKDLMWGVVGRTVGAITALIATAMLVASGAIDRFAAWMLGVIMPLIPFVL